MRRYSRPLVFACLGLSLAVAGRSQTAAERPRIGVFFWHDSPNDLATYQGIRDGLALAGLQPAYLEHRARGDAAAANLALTSLRDAGCDLVFALGTESALRARTALPELPVVFAAVSNPVASGVTADWQGTGSKLCGASNWIAPANVLGVFRLALPRLQRLGVLRSKDTGIVSAAETATMQAHLATLPEPRPQLFEAIAAEPSQLPQAIAELLHQEVDAIWIPIDIGIYPHVAFIQRALGERRIPLLTTAAAALPQGAIVGAVADYALHGQRTAALALRVLRGADPGQLPIDRMQGHRVVVNLVAARRARLELPLSLLALADELLEPDLPHVAR